MLGTVTIKDLKITCIVGIYPKERELLQNLFLDVEMDLDFGAAAQTEDVQHTVDYAEVSDRLEAWVKERKFQLIETLAEQGCLLVFESWPAVQRCKITVKKPGAVPQASYAAVTVERFQRKEQ
jgi:7,8-dihydroneopterin aldolase/epimerase/oxygenase